MRCALVPAPVERHHGPWRRLGSRRVARLRAALADCRGQSILEFALISAVLIMFVFGGLALLNGFTNGVLTSNAARDGARIAAIDCGEGINAQNAVYTAVQTDLKAGGGSSLTYVSSDSGGAPGDWTFTWSCGSTYATVTVDYDAADLFPAVLKMVGMSHPNDFTESSSASFPIE